MVGGAIGLAGVAVAAVLYTQLGSLVTALPAAALLICVALPVFVGGGLLLQRAGVTGRSPGGYPLTLLAPSLAYYAAFFLVPLAFLVAFSVATPLGYGGVSYGFDLGNFSQAFDPIYLRVFTRTLRFAAIGTLLVILVGFPMAYWLARYAPAKRKSLFLGLVIVPFWTSFLIRTYSFLIVLDPHFVLSRGLEDIGLIDKPLHLLYTNTAVQIGIVYNYLPLFVLPVYASLDRLDWKLLDAANDLGSSAFAAMRQVTLPLAIPGLATGTLLVFIPMMGEYVIPQILGGGRVDLMGNIIQRAFLEQQNYPLGAAIAMVLMAALSLFLILYIWLSTRATEVGDA
jgi:spermidine/putrescine transport system permease protein